MVNYRLGSDTAHQEANMSFFVELKRRNVLRVAIAYAIVAWLMLQVADVLLNNLSAPSWVFWVTLMLLAIGFVVVLIFAWVFEMTPEGLKLEKDIDRSQSANTQARKKLDWLILGMLVLTLGYFVVDKFVLSKQSHSDVLEAAREQATGQPESAETVKDTGKSIAVLPFVNMSANQENQYFAVLHMLSQNAALKVAARTSSFAFKGTQTDIRDIADKLNVATVLEGSVQRSGNRVRITAQLIQASDGYHLWSQTFDRDLDNIFAVQDEIATAVTSALTGSLLTGSDDQGLEGDTRNTEAYDLYLQGREAFHANTEREAFRSERLMRRAIALDPDFALAWAGLAEALGRHAVLAGLSPEEYLEESRSAAEKAVELAPDNSRVLTTLGGLHYQVGEYGLAQDVLERALSLDPSNATAWSHLAAVHFAGNRYRDAADAATKAMNIDPLDFNLKGVSTYTFLSLGQVDKAKNLAQAVLDEDPQSTAGLMAMGNIYWRTGQYAEAYRIYHRLLASNPDALTYISRLAISFMDLGDWETAGKIFQRIESVNPLFHYSWWHGDIDIWFCYFTDDMECVRSRLQQRIAQSETEQQRLFLEWQVARFERRWEAALPMSLALIEDAQDRQDSLREEQLSWWAALAADRVGQLELRDELIETVLDYWRAAKAQGSENQYGFYRTSFMHALRGDTASAVKVLRAAIDRGYRDLPAITEFGFFDAIREEPEVQEVLQQLRASNERELERLLAVVEELGPVW